MNGALCLPDSFRDLDPPLIRPTWCQPIALVERLKGGETIQGSDPMTSSAAISKEPRTFKETADYRIRPHGVRVLLTPIFWQEHHNQPGTRTFTAPAGMVHDGASIPLALSFLNGPSIQLAATLHDAAYRFQAWDLVNADGSIVPAGGEPMTRLEADRIIREAARACQERARRKTTLRKATVLSFSHRIQRWVIWAGLRPGGIMAWRTSPEKKDDFDHGVLTEIEKILTALRLATRLAPTDIDLAHTAAARQEQQV